MKSKIALLSFTFLVLQQIGAGQKGNVSKDYNPFNKDLVANPKDTNRVHVSPPVLNRFFAKKLAGYLTGDNSLSLYGSYAVYNTDDDRLFLGFNFANPDDSFFVKDIFTLGFSTEISDKFAPVFNDNKLQRGFAINLKYTISRKGIIRYSPNTHKKRMEEYRIGLKKYLQTKYSLESVLNSILMSGTTREFIKSNNLKLEKQKRQEYLEKELERLEDRDDPIYNTAKKSWFSFTANLPIYSTDYGVAKNFSSAPDTLSSHNWQLGTSYNGFYQKRNTEWFYSVSFTGMRSNSVINKDLTEYSFNKYIILSQYPDTFLLAQYTSDKIYVGDFKKRSSFKASLQGIVYPESKKSRKFLGKLFIERLGVKFQLDKYFNGKNPVNSILGFPITMTGQKNDKKVNVEIQFRYNDIFKKTEPDLTFKKQFTAGISLALPFGSIIY